MGTGRTLLEVCRSINQDVSIINHLDGQFWDFVLYGVRWLYHGEGCCTSVHTCRSVLAVHLYGNNTSRLSRDCKIVHALMVWSGIYHRHLKKIKLFTIVTYCIRIRFNMFAANPCMAFCTRCFVLAWTTGITFTVLTVEHATVTYFFLTFRAFVQFNHRVFTIRTRIHVFRSVFLRIRGSTVIHCRFAFDANIVVAGALDACDICAFFTRQDAQDTAKPVAYTAVSCALFAYPVPTACKHMFCLADVALVTFHIIWSYFLI